MNSNSKRNLLLSLFYLFLTFGLIFLIFKFGIGAAVKISELLQPDKGPLAENPYENILPAPRLFPIMEATNSATLELSGYSIANQKVDIYLNYLNVETFDVDSEGKFKGDITLSLGNNEIYVVTRVLNDKHSPASKSWTIFYGNRPPDIQITEPTKGTLVKKNPNIELKGQVAKTSKVSIDGHTVIIDNDGFFSYPVKLSPGENKFMIVCQDPAMNRTEVEWPVHFQP